MSKPQNGTAGFIKKISWVIKPVIGGLLIYYMMKSKMVDVQSLKGFVFQPQWILLSILFLLSSTFLCSIRWHILCRLQNLSVPLKKIFELTMIGMFFNTFMPGSVGGDLIKAWYITGHEPQQKARAAFSVLVDRILGLAVILFYGGISLFLFRSEIGIQQGIVPISWFLWGFSVLSVVVFVLLFVIKIKLPVLSHPRLQPIEKVLSAFRSYQNYPNKIIVCLGLSALSVTSVTFLHYIFGQLLEIPLELKHYFFFVPVGLTAAAFPLLPGGIGVGQVAYFTLFQWLGVAEPNQGSTLCTIMQVYTILFNCLGVVFYLKYKKPKESSSLPSSRISSLSL